MARKANPGRYEEWFYFKNGLELQKRLFDLTVPMRDSPSHSGVGEFSLSLKERSWRIGYV
jgi:hypothetical protein